MNCFNHPETAAVASCVDCGKGLCKECAALYSLPICNDCNLIRSRNEKSQISSKYIPSMVGAIIGFIIAILIVKDIPMNIISKIGCGFLYAYVFAGISWGWSVINFITPNIFLFMSWFGWVVYFIVKFILSICIGIVAMPIGLIRLLLIQKKAAVKNTNIKSNIGH